MIIHNELEYSPLVFLSARGKSHRSTLTGNWSQQLKDGGFTYYSLLIQIMNLDTISGDHLFKTHSILARQFD